MTGELISSVAQATAATAGVDAVATLPASAADAARFADLMSITAPAAGVDPMPVPAVAASADAPPGLGDAILRSLEEAGRLHGRQTQEIRQVLDRMGGELSASDMLRLHVNMAESSLAIELLGKAVSKATQHVDQLTKLQ